MRHSTVCSVFHSYFSLQLDLIVKTRKFPSSLPYRRFPSKQNLEEHRFSRTVKWIVSWASATHEEDKRKEIFQLQLTVITQVWKSTIKLLITKTTSPRRNHWIEPKNANARKKTKQKLLQFSKSTAAHNTGWKVNQTDWEGNSYKVLLEKPSAVDIFFVCGLFKANLVKEIP